MKEGFRMRYLLNFLLPAMLAAAWVSAQAQGPTYGLGGTPSAEQIRAWDIAIGPEGKELPPGNGTAKEGASLYTQRCAACHGANGEGPESAAYNIDVPPLWGYRDTLPTLLPKKSVGGFWPFATTVFDYINRAMPKGAEGTLNTDQVYAVTAFLLFKNGIIKETDAMDAKTLPKVQMPNRNGFFFVRSAQPKDWEQVLCGIGACR